MRILLTISLSVILSVFVSVGTVFVLNKFILNNDNESIKVLSVKATPVPTPLAKYQITNLGKHKFEKYKIELEDELEENSNFKTYKFSHKFRPSLDTSKKTVTGLVNIPDGNKKYPLVIMIRGYVDKEIYKPGMGSSSAARFFANNNFITISPDFLGYGNSSGEALNVYESRFQTYTTLLSLYNNLDSLKNWDKKNIFIWAHSNGGQIALTFLTATRSNVPTTLWAPVTKAFPYSILYFTDELEDEGKYIRRELSKLEDVYNVDKFSFTNYLARIKAPIQIHQGGLDDAVPKEWSEEFAEQAKKSDVEIDLFIYENADHNLKPNWNMAISRSLEFFKDNLAD